MTCYSEDNMLFSAFIRQMISGEERPGPSAEHDAAVRGLSNRLFHPDIEGNMSLETPVLDADRNPPYSASLSYGESIPSFDMPGLRAEPGPSFSHSVEPVSSSVFAHRHADSKQRPDRDQKSRGQNNLSGKKTSRKRHRDEGQWKRNKYKRLKNQGLEYISRSGKPVAAKVMRPGCTDKCRLKCHETFLLSDRDSIFKGYWSLGDTTAQRQFIADCVYKIKPRRPMRKETEPSRRRQTFIYKLLKHGADFKVCKTFFLDTLGIREDTVFGAFKKVNESGIISPDNRGKHSNHKRVNEEIKDMVRQHIKSFPTIPSHYIEETPCCLYLNPDLNISKMYNLYTNRCKEMNAPCVKMSMYRDIFHSEFNFTFHKVDKCKEINLHPHSAHAYPTVFHSDMNVAFPKTRKDLRSECLAVNSSNQREDDNPHKQHPWSKEAGLKEKRNKHKLLKNRGLQYTSASGKAVPARTLGQGCTQKCRFKCHETFPPAYREAIFQHYWVLGDITSQRQFITKFVYKMKPLRPGRREADSSRRRQTFVYKLLKDGVEFKVCKTFFLDTLGIREDTVFGAFRKTNENGFVSPDERGKHTNHKRVDEAVKDIVRRHIESFPTVPSSHSKQNSACRYLSPDLNISKMYGLYNERCKQMNLPCAKMSMYRYIFHSEYNLAFHKPRKDQRDNSLTFDSTQSLGERNNIRTGQHFLRHKELPRKVKGDTKEVCGSKNTGYGVEPWHFSPW